MNKKTKEEAERELALINGEYGAYLIDDGGKRRTQDEAIREVTKDLLIIQDRAKLVLANMLHEIYSKEYFNTWGFESFMDYTKKELDFEYRQAMYLVDIWEELKNKRGIPMEVLKKSTWSKLKEIVRVAKMSAVITDDIEALIEDSSSMTVEEVSFKSKELIYESYGAAGEPKPEKTHRLTLILFKEQYDNFKKAMSCAEEISTSEKSGANLDLVCTSYIASHIPSNPKEELRRIAKMLESTTGAKLLVTLDGTIVHANEEFNASEDIE